jgi:transcriptional regulator with XRE-family HTH domain
MYDKIYPDPEARGKRIREMRKKKGLTVKQLADMLDVDPGTMSRYQTGSTQKIPRPVLESLAAALDTDIDYLNTGKTPEPERGIQKQAASPDTLGAPNPLYANAYKQSKVFDALPELKKNKHSDFILIVEEDSLAPRISGGDRLWIRQCEQFMPEKVNVILSRDRKILLFRIVEKNGSIALSTRDGVIEILSDTASSSCGLMPVGYCTKLETQNP